MGAQNIEQGVLCSSLGAPNVERGVLCSSLGAPNVEWSVLRESLGAPNVERGVLRSSLGAPNVERGVLRSSLGGADVERGGCGGICLKETPHRGKHKLRKKSRGAHGASGAGHNGEAHEPQSGEGFTSLSFAETRQTTQPQSADPVPRTHCRPSEGYPVGPLTGPSPR